MSIVANCPKCSFTLKVKDDFAGKRVKCPKCETAVQIPAANGDKKPVGAATAKSSPGGPAPVRPEKPPPAAARPRYNPLLDLLDEAGVEAAPRGDVCPSCSAAIKPGHVLCMECGYHFGLGKKMETSILIDEDDVLLDDTRTDAEKRMAKAEKEIEDTPIGEFGQDFGEGKESFLIATVAIIFLVLFMAGGVTVVLTMDVITEYISSQMISLLASIGMAAMSISWITSVAFRLKPLHGVACLLTGGLYCIPFGFMQGKALFLPAIILSMSLVIGLASAYFVFNPPEDEDAAIRLLNFALLHWSMIRGC